MPQLLSDDDLAAALAELPGVHRAESGTGSLVIRAELPEFLAAVQLIVDVARVAEELDHHPDIDLRWRTVVFGLSTHSAGGVTGLDVDLARRIVQLAASSGGRILPPGGAAE